MRTGKFNIKIKKILGDGTKKIIVKLIFPFRNRFILFNISNKAKKNKVNIDYWDEAKNLGDALSPIIVNYMLELKGISTEKTVSGCKHLYAVGSVLTAGIQDATVWGSGILNAKLTYRLKGRKLDIRAVRGPITRAILLDYGFLVPTIYGDPAILMPEVYYPQNVNKNGRSCLVVHKDYDLSTNDITQINKNKIDKLDIRTDDYKSFIDQLISYDKVISSSLHGIIIAESYGVKAILLKPQIDIVKYYDYYYSTDRLTFPIAETIEEAIKMRPIDLPDFTKMKNELKESFPYDIYEC